MGTIVTVLGPIESEHFGPALVHEHILVDFIGADKTGYHRWDREKVVQRMKPHLIEVKEKGIKGFVDCTPAYIGRDPWLLQRLAVETGLHILTNTGLYKEPYLPPYAFQESAGQLAERWVQEFEKGIETSRVKPGFIKIAVNPGSLIPIQIKIVQAAARASKATGMVIACHTGHGPAGMEALDLLEKEGLSPSRFIVVHADAEKDPQYHYRWAERGAWVEYDGIGGRPLAEHIQLILQFKEKGYLHRLLISHDAGWYDPDQPKGGQPRGYTTIMDDLIPALKKAGITEQEIRQILQENPQKAFQLAKD